jgi:hypothetical protein
MNTYAKRGEGVATAPLDLEPQLRRLKNYRALPQLRQALKANVQKLKKSA